MVKAHDIVSHNVIAQLPGASRPDEFIVYGAHWDAYGKGAPTADGDDIRNGAVDNATGTAEVLEIARVFAHGKRPARSLLFMAYTAEEKGLLGSEYYASHPIHPLERTAAVINLDPHVQLGRARDIELVGAGRTDLEDDLSRAAQAEGLRVEIEPHPEAGWYFRSDQYSFAKRGVPALSFRIGRDLVDSGLSVGTTMAEDYNVNRYHQPKDEFDPNWTFEGSAQEATVAWRIGAQLADSTRWPGWKSGAEFADLRLMSESARHSGASVEAGAVTTVKALRSESNAAIKAHDAVRLRKLLDDDYHGIQGTSGALDSGGDATARSYADEEFKDATFVAYTRTPTSIVEAESGKRVAETGNWIGTWRKADGTMRKTGVYLAMWIPGGKTWRLKSESFVTLACTGSAACDKAG